ncbi:DUF501 domain-containing protein [Candidatus Acetothermia bacterium]|jgi:hypothetical protein|nr:DUF501 domain-containing protein [Candidatus Acetothermia bacterium]MCI2427506.1 DUF501 domain-containing protein [Candidatus Acetothermia bacterium]MCI2428008.1 DUF501 domain-containing protein [Candidatus Acetothermia bacterium]
MEPVTSTERWIIARQIGREPRHLFAIALRCSHGYPQVTINYPLRIEKGTLIPFPTLFWLTCPYLRLSIGRLEAAGLIREAEQMLRATPRTMETYHADHKKYIAERWQLINESDKEQLVAQGMIKNMLERGIGGLTNHRKIKCLHLHYAHYLARGNIVGEFVDHLLAERECRACLCGEKSRE